MATDFTGFLDDLSAEEITELRGKGRPRRFPKGSTLFNEGETSDRVAVVLEGRVKVSFFTDDGKEIILAVRGPGELLGELSALDGEPRSATATALEPVEALIVTAEDFRTFVASHPGVSLMLLVGLSRRLREADHKRVEFGAFDTTGRVARRLLELADRFGELVDGSVKIKVPLSQQDLAGWVGCSREAVSKALQSLRSKGLIETARREVTIIDQKALTRRAR